MKLKTWVKAIILSIIILIAIFLYLFFFKKEQVINKDNNSSKTLNVMKETNYYNEKYNDEYSKIDYIEKDNFEKNIALFLDKNYSGEEINKIFKLSDKNIEKLKNMDYKDISKYVTFKNFDVDKIDRYKNYEEKNKNYDLKNIITYVNVNLDLDPYEKTNEVKDYTNELAIVNKYNGLPTSYKPMDLENVNGFYGNDVPMRKIAKDAFLKLQSAAKENNLELMPTTAYRSASFQKTLYDNYVAKDGVKGADTYSARPGFSDHQTGLAIDLKNPAIKSGTRLNEDDFAWLEQNCAKYGFIIRYPKGKEHITLYQFENWHIRYVGIEAATYIMNNKLTLEEYIDLYITEY